jgi:hypothetical protein
MKLCAFCLREGKMSAEHLWGDWIGKLFVEYRGRYSFRTQLGENPILRWSSRSIDAKAKVVCETCNNGWMSDLDGETKSLMEGIIRDAAPICFLPSGIRLFAAFAFKTAVVIDHIRPSRGRPFFSPNQRRKFSETREVPPCVQVWISAFKGDSAVSGRYTTHYAQIRGGTMKGFELYIFTFVAGSLAYQLVGSRWISIAKKPIEVPVLTQHQQWDRASIPLWPGNGQPVIWPPAEYFDDKFLNLYAQRWEKLIEIVPRQ